MTAALDTKHELHLSDNISQAPSSRRTSFSSIDPDENLPPPYDAVPGGTSQQVPAYSADPNGPVHFPSRFNLYHKKTQWRRTTWTLGEHFNQPLFSIVLLSGWKGTKFVLHRGLPDDASAKLTATDMDSTKDTTSLLAEIGSKRYMSIHNTISLPQHSITEEMHTKLSFNSPSYSFTAPVAHGEKTVLEMFVWRQSHGKEVQQVSLGKKMVSGWKLVRVDVDIGEHASNGNGGGGEIDSTIMNPDAMASSSHNRFSKRSTRDLGESSDGKEVVAAWADNLKWSKNKLVRFEFLGSGVTGELGEVFEIMAVASGMRIWQTLRMGSSGGGVEASSGAAVAAAGS